jgi:hypothetical protein
MSIVHTFCSLSVWSDQSQWMSLTNSVPLFRLLLTTAYFGPHMWPPYQSLYKTISIICGTLKNIFIQYNVFCLNCVWIFKVVWKLKSGPATCPELPSTAHLITLATYVQVASCAITIPPSLTPGHSSTPTRPRVLSWRQSRFADKTPETLWIFSYYTSNNTSQWTQLLVLLAGT